MKLEYSSLELFPKQEEAFNLLGGDNTYTLLHGGGGSGKTAVLCLALIIRCLAIPNSLHGVFRNTGISLKNSVFEDTFKKVLRTFLDGKLIERVQFVKDDMEVIFPNGSKIIFTGLDSERIERLYGLEFTTIWVNEISEIARYSPTISTLIFRLRQPSLTQDGTPARHKCWMDCNPPTRGHWAEIAFIRKVNPVTGIPHANPDDWRELAMNTADNPNLPPGYIDQLKAGLSEREQRRLIYGEWLNNNDNSLFPLEVISKHRHKLPPNPADQIAEIARLRDDMVRVVIAVDPATTSTTSSDLHGIVVAGLDENGEAYVFEDASFKGSPQALAKRVADLFDRWGASLVVAEKNQGGDMVEHTLRTGGYRNLPVKLVHAMKGKVLRAEPISLPYEKGIVHHVGEFKELEDQMDSFTLDYNRSRQGSPDRLDALVYAMTELLLGKRREPSVVHQSTVRGFYG